MAATPIGPSLETPPSSNPRIEPGPDAPAKNTGLWNGDAGSALVEFTVTLPVLFALLFCFMELCLAFYTRDMISERAREGTRYAIVHGATCPTSANPTCEATASQINSYVAALGLPDLAGGTMTVATSYPDGNEAVGSRVAVTVTYLFRIGMPFVPKTPITMSSTSTMYIIQ